MSRRQSNGEKTRRVALTRQLWRKEGQATSPLRPVPRAFEQGTAEYKAWRPGVGVGAEGASIGTMAQGSR